MPIIFIGLNILDAYLTKAGLAVGAMEVNPVAAPFASSMFLKGLVATVIVIGLYFWGKEHLLLPLCLGMFGICLWNLSQWFIGFALKVGPIT